MMNILSLTVDMGRSRVMQGFIGFRVPGFLCLEGPKIRIRKLLGHVSWNFPLHS